MNDFSSKIKIVENGKIKYLIVLFLLLLSLQIIAQSNIAIEKELYSHFEKTRTDYYSDKINYDTVLTENDMFTAELIYYLKTKPATIDYNFSKLTKHNLNINNSADGNFRIYSWVINWGGDDPEVFNIFQYRLENKHGVWSDKDNDNAGGYVLDIFQAKLNDDQYYFPYLLSPQSNSPRVEEVTNLAVTVDGAFKYSGLFLTDPSKLKDSFVISYLPSSVLKGIDCKISFDEKTQTFTVPVINHKTLKFTSKFLKYKYNGEYFKEAIPGKDKY